FLAAVGVMLLYYVAAWATGGGTNVLRLRLPGLGSAEDSSTEQPNTETEQPTKQPTQPEKTDSSQSRRNAIPEARLAEARLADGRFTKEKQSDPRPFATGKPTESDRFEFIGREIQNG
ncbi:MAG: hypothetical protein N2C14_14365, partial [Planctomycetales bacterium]